MLKTIDHLVHFTTSMDAIAEIFKYGFKPSYANELLAGRKIKVPMVSFCNILLRDSGNSEVLSYGDYGVLLTREWAIGNQLNPVIYTYDEGLLNNAIQIFLENSLFLTFMTRYKDTIKKYSDAKGPPISKYMDLSNTSKQAKAILDYLSTKYDEDLIHLLSEHSKAIHETNFRIVTLTKPYKVNNNKGNAFIAYNDREWRKIYPDLKFLMEEDDEYEKWEKTAKPHFHKDPYLLHFNLSDVKAIMVKDDAETDTVINMLRKQYGQEADDSLKSGALQIGTKEKLEEQNF